MSSCIGFCVLSSSVTFWKSAAVGACAPAAPVQIRHANIAAARAARVRPILSLLQLRLVRRPTNMDLKGSCQELKGPLKGFDTPDCHLTDKMWAHTTFMSM